MDLNPIEEGQLGQAGFGKQRRNLLVTSVLLTAGLWVGVSFAPLGTITIYGHEFLLLTRPGGIAHIAWMVWLYFLIRYVAFHLQYQKGQEKFVYLFRAGLRNAYREFINSELLKQGKTISEYNVDIFRTTFLGTCYISARTCSDPPLKETIRLSTSRTKIMFARTRVLAKVLFGSAVTSEYYLPYLVALLPVVLLLIRGLL